MADKMLPIKEVAARFGIEEAELYFYGPYKAKLEPSLARRVARCDSCGRQVLVTATTPTPAGEGKTTTAIGLSMGLNRIGVKSIVTLREPSLGPVFGMKGGATGGGASQVLPSDEIDLHFTGDIHAVTTANNLLAAMIDNHIQQGNRLAIDTRRIAWRRVIDMNDRALREIVIGLGGRQNGFAREDAFNISVASEVMAVLCLADDFQDLKDRLARMVIGYTAKNKPIPPPTSRPSAPWPCCSRTPSSPTWCRPRKGRRPSSTAAPSPTSPTAPTPSRPCAWPRPSRRSRSPKPASPRSWAAKNSWISSARRESSTSTRWCWSPPCGP